MHMHGSSIERDISEKDHAGEAGHVHAPNFSRAPLRRDPSFIYISMDMELYMDWIAERKLASILHARVLLLHHGLSHFAACMAHGRLHPCKHRSSSIGDPWPPFDIQIH